MSACIDLAESLFRQAWTFFEDVEKPAIAPSSSPPVMIQPILARALHALSREYFAVSAAERLVISRKGRLNRGAFVSRMRRFAQYRRALRQTISDGRCLGDAFVWLFYQNHPEMLEKHMSHPPQPFLPPGQGGLLEVMAASTPGLLKGRIVLHHVVTNILRIGDFTVVDPNSMKIVGLGEFKGAQLSEGAITGVATIAATRPELLDFLGRQEAAPSTDSGHVLSQRQESKIHVQQRRMARTLIEKPLPNPSHIRVRSYIEQLRDFLTRIPTGRAVSMTISDSMVFIGLRPRKARKSHKLLTPGYARGLAPQIEPVQAAVNSLKPALTTEDDTLWIQPLQRFPQGQTVVLGVPPLCFWPISMESRREVFFADVIVWTAYNPGNFLRKLRNRGFFVRVDHRERYVEISRTRRGLALVIGNVDYYFKLLAQCLVSEDSVVDMIEKLADQTQVDAKTPAGTMKCVIDFRW